jgi:hypothetical protein
MIKQLNIGLAATTDNDISGANLLHGHIVEKTASGARDRDLLSVKIDHFLRT